MTSSSKTKSNKWIKAVTVGAAAASAIAAILAATIGQGGIPGLAKNNNTTQPTISVDKNSVDINEENRNTNKPTTNNTVRKASSNLNLELPQEVAQTYAPQTISGGSGNTQNQGNGNKIRVENNGSSHNGNSSNHTNVNNQKPNNVTNCTGGGTNTNCGSGGTFNTTVNPTGQ